LRERAGERVLLPSPLRERAGVRVNRAIYKKTRNKHDNYHHISHT
jgi:hypothetical protein